jgi:pSer/pThr/pTyr-binding forkhead associated (FHA) protein
MLASVANGPVLEIVEGPGAGRQFVLDRPVVIGRAPETDLVLEDTQVSRRHAKVSPAGGDSAVVEDLGSANGTFVNRNQLYGAVGLDPGDELLVGVTVIQLRSSQQVAARPSAVRTVPPALATAPRAPDYVNPEEIGAEVGGQPARRGTPQLDKYLDVRVRRRAQLAPLALFVLVALALIIYFATR